jgi:hypothetical protein
MILLSLTPDQIGLICETLYRFAGSHDPTRPVILDPTPTPSPLDTGVTLAGTCEQYPIAIH